MRIGASGFLTFVIAAANHLSSATISAVAGKVWRPLVCEQPSVSEVWNPGIVYADISDVGMRRANNQDSLACLPAQNADRFRLRGHLFVVADGMGAHAAGELASRIATERIALHYFKSTASSVAEALREAVCESNAEIHRRGQQNPEFHNMGTTASSLVLTPAGAVVAHVGDSRVYRLRRGTLEQLTFDHSLVWEMEASGQVQAGSPLRHTIPKNVITRSLGPNADVAVDVEGPFPVEPGDTFLLCSDGLTGQVEDPEIGAIVDSLPADLAARVLVDLTNLRGGPDNTTVIIIRVEDDRHFLDSDSTVARGKLPQQVAPALLVTTAGCFLIAAGLAMIQEWGKMVVALILGLIASVVCVVQYRTPAHRPHRVTPTPAAGGKGPYRRFNAAATEEHHRKLAGTVEALRQAAKTKHWSLDWSKIDRLQKESSRALHDRQPKRALRLEAEAIIETMHQLRAQHGRSAADESAIDY